MTVLITVRSGQQMLGRCDATCYNAKGHRCQCVCGGRNHAAGLHVAQQNLIDFMTDIFPELKKRFPQATEIIFHRPPLSAHFHAPQPNPHTLPRPAA